MSIAAIRRVLPRNEHQLPLAAVERIQKCYAVYFDQHAATVMSSRHLLCCCVHFKQ